MENQQLNQTRYESAKEHVNKVRKFAVSVLVFCLFFVIFNGNDIFRYNDFNFGFGDVSLLFWIWGIILVVKAVKLFIFDERWERKSIDKILKDK